MMKIWFLSPARLLVNASHELSGAHCGFPQDFSPRVSWNVFPVAIFAIQMCVTKASCFQSVSLTVYATHLPSGEICVPKSDLTLSRSSIEGRRCCALTVNTGRRIKSSEHRLSISTSDAHSPQRRRANGGTQSHFSLRY